MVRALGALALALLLACDQAAPDPPQPAAISVMPARAELAALEEIVRLTAAVRDQNGQPMPSAPVTWTSTGSTVATVDGSGLVTAAANGVATITATAGMVSAMATVTVAQVVSTVTVTPAADTVVEADTLRLSAVAADANGHEVGGTLVRWTSADTLVAVVNALALVRGVKAGVAVVEASTASGVTGRAEIVVVPPVPSAVSVSPDTVAFEALGAMAVLTAAVSDQAGRLMEGVAVSWTAGDTAIAVVDSAGVVTAAAEGETAITATAGAASGSAAVTVAQVVGSVAVTPAADTVELGDTLRLSAEAFDGNGHRVAGARFDWRSSDTAVARVDQAGLMRGSGEGTAAITATAGDASAEVEIAVVNPDRAALVALYKATGGQDWTHRANWLTDSPLGYWHGVRGVNEEGRVTHLGLVRNGLTGRIPPELGNLTALERLDLWSNDLTGPIPPELGNLTALRTLWLSNNELTGQIPPELGNLSALERLYLRSNALTGEIPPELGKLSALEWLWLHVNGLTGEIPPELGNLTELVVLDLSSNALIGPIPPELGNLTALETLGLSSNALIGPIPPELGNLTALERLDLSRNALTGPIPPELGNLKLLEGLYLIENRLAGPFPATMLNLTALEGLGYTDTGLCLPGTERFWQWRLQLHLTQGSEVYCNDADRSALAALYEAADGSGWHRRDQWLEEDSVAVRLGIHSGDPVLSEWYGVTTDFLGRVTGLSLPANNLAGRIAPVGTLSGLRILDVEDNPHLQGPLPLSLTRAPMDTLRFAGTGLCSLPGARDWLEFIAVVQGTGETCEPLSDRDVLVALYHGTDGPNWSRGNVGSNYNWLSDAPLGDWYGVDVNEEGRVTELRLAGLTGPIPPELGNLTELGWLYLNGNDLTGPIPPELGNLSALVVLSLSHNDLSGPIPSELGNLTALRWMDLNDNDLTGEIPPELGNLTALRTLWLSDNALTGPIPPELGNLKLLERLDLGGNNLTGPIPSDFGSITRLRELTLSPNEGLSGPLPTTLTALSRLKGLVTSNTGLCAPADPGFQAWANALRLYWVRQCSIGTAYLVQSVQSRNHPVPLVAGRDALLRVFPTAPSGSLVPVPAVRTTFYAGGAQVYSVDTSGKPGLLPAEIDEGELAVSANVEIPGDVLRPGLEMVIEVDPEGTLDPSLGVSGRIPAEGRTALEIHALPTMELTIVPFLWTEDPDSSILATVRGMAADPEGHELLRLSRALLPASDWTVTAHEPVWTDFQPAFGSSTTLVHRTRAIRAMEGGRGYWMGTLTGDGGRAYTPGWESVSGLDGATIAHELGHNLSLEHAPCGGPSDADANFPNSRGRIGAWGYDFTSNSLVSPGRPDVMSYCQRGPWISDYHFTNALHHRVRAETPPNSVRALLLWGGESESGGLHLDPAFVVDAVPVLPDSTGGYTLTGRDADSRELFSVAFAMPEIADGGEAAGGFAYTLPVRPGWEALASVTLTAPDARTATLDTSTDRPMTILRDSRTGRVRAFLDGVSAAVQADGGGEDLAAKLGAVAITSRGIPGSGAWPR